MTKIINLLGGPGSGKSLTAAGIFYELKIRDIECELVSEFPKELTWEKNLDLLENQLFVFAEQFRRQYRLLGKVDFVITDSPLILSKIYMDIFGKRSGKFTSTFSKTFQSECLSFFDTTYNEFDNILFYIDRPKNFSPNGRNETENEAHFIDEMILNEIEKYDYHRIPSQDAVEKIIKILETTPSCKK